jgi:hypothetical protein
MISGKGFAAVLRRFGSLPAKSRSKIYPQKNEFRRSYRILPHLPEIALPGLFPEKNFND